MVENLLIPSLKVCKKLPRSVSEKPDSSALLVKSCLKLLRDKEIDHAAPEVFNFSHAFGFVREVATRFGCSEEG